MRQEGCHRYCSHRHKHDLPPVAVHRRSCLQLSRAVEAGRCHPDRDDEAVARARALRARPRGSEEGGHSS